MHGERTGKKLGVLLSFAMTGSGMIACGSQTSSNASTPGSDSGAVLDAGSTPDTGTKGDTSVGDGGVQDASLKDTHAPEGGSSPPDGGPQGKVWFDTDTESASGYVSADFWSDPDVLWNGFKVVLATASCVVHEGTTPQDPDAGSPPYESAGALSVATPALDGPVLLTHDPILGGYSLMAEGLFGTGNTLSTSATGGVVPAFSHSIVAPPPVTLIAPTSPWAISTGQDLDVSWSGGVAGDTVEITLIANFADARTDVATCTFGASGGNGTVPQAVLAHLANPLIGSISWDQRADAWFQAGMYWIDLLSTQTQEAEATFP
jgi:hypothetical protein